MNNSGLKLFVSKGLVSVITAGIFIGLNPTIALAEIYEIEWQKSLGGSDVDAVNSIQQTDDGGYIIAGL